MLSNGWTAVAGEDTLYSLESGSSLLLLCFHVNYILVASSHQEALDDFKRQLLQWFDAKDLGPVSTFLWIKVVRDHSLGTISLSQTQLIEDLLARHGLSDFNPTKTPLSPGCKLLASDCPEIPDPVLGRQYRDICSSLELLGPLDET